MSLFRCLVLSLALTVPGVTAENQDAAPDEIHVLVIHSYGPGSVWVNGIEKGLSESVPSEVELHHSYLNTKKLPAKHHDEAAERSWQDFIDLQPDLVVLCDDNAMLWLGERISRRVPVVFCGINGGIREDYPWAVEGREVTGVMERPVIRRAAYTVNQALNLSATKVLFLLGNSTTAKAFLKHDMSGERKPMIWGDLRAEVRLTDNLASFQEEVRQSRDEGFDFLLIAGHQSLRDENGRAMTLAEINQWISRNSPLPPFTVHLNSIGRNQLIGGLTLLGSMMGKAAGILVQQVVDNNLKTQGIPIVYYNQGKIVMSKSELERWNLTVSPEFLDKTTFVD